MESREYGLVVAKQLLAVDDLHYGLWGDLDVTVSNLPVAQQRYTDMIIEALPPAGNGACRVLDIGCGTGHVLSQMLRRGYRADGVIPSASLARLVRARLDDIPGHDTRVLESTFEALDLAPLEGQYDVALFCESFQYIRLRDVFDRVGRILKPGGYVVICDFFKTEHADDGTAAGKSFGGGHPLVKFRQALAASPLELVRDEDITAEVSPTIDLLDALLTQRIGPAIETTGVYLRARHPWVTRTLAWLLRKRLRKIRLKYFSGYRTQAVFERYKNYRLLVLRKPE